MCRYDFIVFLGTVFGFNRILYFTIIICSKLSFSKKIYSISIQCIL